VEVAVQDEIALARHASILARVLFRLHDAEFARRRQQRSAQSNNPRASTRSFRRDKVTASATYLAYLGNPMATSSSGLLGKLPDLIAHGKD